MTAQNTSFRVDTIEELHARLDSRNSRLIAYVEGPDMWVSQIFYHVMDAHEYCATLNKIHNNKAGVQPYKVKHHSLYY